MIDMDVINLKNGEVIGKFDDVEIDVKAGRISAFYIEEASRLMNMLGKSKPKKIKWEEILKIGSDVILVNVDDEANNRVLKDMIE